MIMSKIEGVVARAFNKLGISISRKMRPELVYRGQEFSEFIKHISSRSLINEGRLLMLWQFANSATSVNGHVAEMGVYKGGSAKLLAKAFERNAEKTVFLFDTFCGMPETDPLKDVNRKGDFSDTSFESVQEFLGDCQNVVLYKGLFSDTLGNVADKAFCFVHIDCDIYQSALECCEFFYPRMTRMGIMIFDDYIYSELGVKPAVDHYFSDKTERPVLLPWGQCIVIKA